MQRRNIMDTPPNSSSTNQAGGQAPNNAPAPAAAPTAAPLSNDELNTLHALARAISSLGQSAPQSATNGQPSPSAADAARSSDPPVVPTTADYASAAAQLAIYQFASPSTTAAWFAFVPPAVAAADAAINPKRRNQALRGLVVSGVIGAIGFAVPRLIR
jgi:hypothetical protein